MKSIAYNRYALRISILTVLLTACGESQAPISAPIAIDQMMGPKPIGYKQNLLYVSAGAENVYVYSYPGGKWLGPLGYFESPGPECADKSGNVFISTAQGIYEYAHDGADPIAILDVRGNCAADPVVANLDVCGGDSVVDVFHHNPKHGWLLPRRFIAAFSVRNCGYDNKGNLFVDGLNTSNVFQFAELPAKGKSFLPITLNQSIGGPGQIQWDGSNVAVEDSTASPSVLYRFSISGSIGQKVGSTVLESAATVSQFWIQGKEVVGSVPDEDELAFWAYPDGGSPLNTATSSAYGVTVSVHR